MSTTSRACPVCARRLVCQRRRVACLSCKCKIGRKSEAAQTGKERWTYDNILTSKCPRVRGTLLRMASGHVASAASSNASSVHTLLSSRTSPRLCVRVHCRRLPLHASSTPVCRSMALLCTCVCVRVVACMRAHCRVQCVCMASSLHVRGESTTRAGYCCCCLYVHMSL